jgi:hypothetical protein
MDFQRPYLLFLLCVPLLLAIVAWRRRGACVASPAAPQALRPQIGLDWLLRLPALIPPALVAVFIVLLAGPIRYEQSTGRAPKSLTNVQFCLNVSNSMLAKQPDVHCRYCAAASAIGPFVRGREGDAFGLTLFGTIPIIWVPLTDDVSAIYRAAKLCYPDHMPNMVSEYPDTAAGLRVSIEQLAQRAKGTGGRLLIVLTDGEDPHLAQHAEELVELMNREDISMQVLFFQNSGRGLVLDQMARRTQDGGLYECASAQNLSEVFDIIDNMKKIEYEVGAPQQVPETRPWLAAGGALWLIYLCSLFGLRYTPW